MSKSRFLTPLCAAVATIIVVAGCLGGEPAEPTTPECGRAAPPTPRRHLAPPAGTIAPTTPTVADTPIPAQTHCQARGYQRSRTSRRQRQRVTTATAAQTDRPRRRPPRLAGRHLRRPDAHDNGAVARHGRQQALLHPRLRHAIHPQREGRGPALDRHGHHLQERGTVRTGRRLDDEAAGGRRLPGRHAHHRGGLQGLLGARRKAGKHPRMGRRQPHPGQNRRLEGAHGRRDRRGQRPPGGRQPHPGYGRGRQHRAGRRQPCTRVASVHGGVARRYLQARTGAVGRELGQGANRSGAVQPDVRPRQRPHRADSCRPRRQALERPTRHADHREARAPEHPGRSDPGDHVRERRARPDEDRQ